MLRLIRLIIVALVAFVCGVLYERARADEACPVSDVGHVPAHCERTET